MKVVIAKSVLFSILCALLTLFFRSVLHTENLLQDVGGLSAFATMFGTLYGIITAFIVFEVWGEYNKTTHLIEMESQAWERLYHLIEHLHNGKLTAKMRDVIEDYIRCVVDEEFISHGKGVRHHTATKYFHAIAKTLHTIRATEEHDQTVLDHILDQFGDLSEIRTERINQSITRLPIILKVFLYATSMVALITFIIMPFVVVVYNLFVVASLTFVLAMAVQLIEDLDNPFSGYWNVSHEPFERALNHIDDKY